jgi:ribosomal protein L36
VSDDVSFDDPYFVTQHAIERFQDRVRKLPRSEVIMEVQHALQYPMRVVEEDWESEYKVYFALYRQPNFSQVTPYYPVVGEGEEKWPAVVTIKARGSVLHGKLCGNEQLIKRKGRAMILPEVAT